MQSPFHLNDIGANSLHVRVGAKSAALTVGRSLPVFPDKRQFPSRLACLKSAMCGRLRVGKDFLHVRRLGSVQPCVRPVGAVHMTAGHNALRGSDPGQKPAFDNAMALDCMSLPQMRRLTLDVATRVTRMGRAEPQTWRASRGPSYRSLCRNRYVKIA